jgi:hypothetical protein
VGDDAVGMVAEDVLSCRGQGRTAVQADGEVGCEEGPVGVRTDVVAAAGEAAVGVAGGE